MKKSKKMWLAATTLALALPLLSVSSSAIASQQFNDVPSTHPASEAISELSERDVIKGFGDGTFKPTKKLTRAEFAAFVARSLELPKAESNFKDVSKSMALYDGISRAYKAGIIKGFGDGTFKPNTLVSREDMAVMIDRAMQSKGSYTKTKTLDFSDKSKVGAYAKTSVERLYYYDVMGNYNGKNFEPKTVGNRADTAMVIYNMLMTVEKSEMPEPPVNPNPEPEPPVTTPEPPVITPEPTPEPPVVNPVDPKPGDVAYVKGIRFTMQNTGFWNNDYGSTYGNTLPAKQNEVTPGTRYNFRNFTEDKYSIREGFLVQYLIYMDMPFSKDEMLGLVAEVGSSGKSTTVKGYTFSLDPNPMFKGDVLIELK